MKPLVLWCRWHEARLRLMGRSPDEVWGELSFAEKDELFRYQLQSRRLTVGQKETERELWLDEMGVELPTSDAGNG